jgi:hypothetical protein
VGEGNPDYWRREAMNAARVVAELRARLREGERLVAAMHDADEAYGCGFYSDASWLTPYRALRYWLRAGVARTQRDPP